MKIVVGTRIRSALLAACAWLAWSGTSAAAIARASPYPGAQAAQTGVVDIAAQPLGAALAELGRKTGREIVAPSALIAPHYTSGARRIGSVEVGLNALLRDTGLTWRKTADGAYVITPRQPTPPSSAAYPVADVLVTGTRYQAREEISNRRRSVGLVDTLSQDDTGDLADQSLAEALRRIPGVSTLYDEDEGSLITIRGIQPDWNHVTLDGLTLASVGTGGAGRRQVDLALIPSSSSRRTEIFKTFAADLDAGAVGGVMNIVPRSAYDRRNRLLLLDVYGNDFTYDAVPGANSLNGPLDSRFGGGFNLVYSDRFGARDVFGLTLTAGFQRKQRDQTNVNTPRRAYYTVDGLTTTPASSDWAGRMEPGQFVTHNLTNAIENAGGSARLEYRPGDRLHASLMLFHYTQGEDETRNANNFSALEPAPEAPGQAGLLHVAEYRVAYRHHTYDRDTRGAQLSLRWRLDDMSDLAFRAGRSRASYRDVMPDIAYGFTAGGLLQVLGGLAAPTFSLETPSAYLDPANFQHRSASLMREDVVGTLNDIRLDYARNAEFDAQGWGLKAGLSRRRFELRRDTNYTVYVSDRASLSGFEYLSDFTPRGWPYPLLWVDGRRFLADKTPTLAVNAAVSARDSLAEDYAYSETIMAGYVLASFASPRLKLAGGLRYDQSDSEGDVARADANGVTFASVSGDYDGLLPSAHLTYLIAGGLRLKAAYSRSIGRPNPRDLARPETRDDARRTISRGNPGIRPRQADNFDLGLEAFFNGDSGLLSLSLFRKAVRDDILMLTTEQLIEGVAYAVTQPENAERASQHGVELNLINERLDHMPGVLKDRVGISINASRLWGQAIHLTDDGRRLTLDRLPFQSDWLANAAVFVALPRGGEARLAVNHQSRFVSSFGAQPWLNEGWDAFTTWDFTVRQQLADALLVKFQIRNIGDANRIGLLGADLEWRRRDLEFGRSFYLHLIRKF